MLVKKPLIEMTTLQQLLEQKAALEKQIGVVLKHQRTAVIAQVKSLIDQHGLTASDLGLKGTKKGSTVAAKYSNQATGETWSGRGLQPKWLKAALLDGRKLEDFAV